MSRLTVLSLLQAAHAVEHTPTIVVDTPVWTLGVRYPDMSIQLGEALKFSTYGGGHDLVLVHAPTTGTHWDQCGTLPATALTADAYTSIFSVSDFPSESPAHRLYQPPTCGDFYLACSVGNHCGFGQKVKVTVNNVDGSACSSPCQDAQCVTADSRLQTAQDVHEVIPCASDNSCTTTYWGMGAPMNTLTVAIGDTVKFTTAPFHDVASVPTLDAFSSCTLTEKTLLAQWVMASPTITDTCEAAATCCSDSSCGTQSGFSTTLVTYTWEATTAGDTYFVCSIGNHCSTGQKFHVTVSPSADTTASPSADADSVACSKQVHIHLAVVILTLLHQQVMALA